MTVERNEELVSLQHAGRIVRATIAAMAGALEPGMTTLELDRVGEAFAERHGAVSGPRRFYDFPGFSCISVNDEAVHGVPGSRSSRPATWSRSTLRSRSTASSPTPAPPSAFLRYPRARPA